MPDHPRTSVFLSHSSADKPLVRELRQSLESLGVKTWVDTERLAGGDVLLHEIKANIEKAEHFLVVLSIAALNSDWVQAEIKHARAAGKKVIAVTRPDIGSPILKLLLGGDEPLAIRLEDGADTLAKTLPHILAALGLQLPTEVIQHAQVQAAPVADLVLTLSNLAIEQLEDGKIRRATAQAKLVFTPAEPGSRDIEGKPYRFIAPLGPIEAGDLAWYLEDHYRWPSQLFDERAKQIEANLPRWGQLLFDTLSTAQATRAPLEAWRSAAGGERRFTVKVDGELIEGAPPAQQIEANEAATAFLALPWELLHDGKVFLFQGAHPVRVRRSLPNSLTLSALATDPPIRVLLISPRPEDDATDYIDHRISAKPVIEALSGLGPSLVHFKILEPPTYPALVAELARAADAQEPYHVIHFDGHGVWSHEHGLGMLCFENPADLAKLEGRRHELIDAGKLAGLVHERHVPLFFLEACQTAMTEKDPSASVAGRLLESGVASVVAMTHSVLVETARRFIKEFYSELLQGKRVGQAMLAGQRTLHADPLRGKKFDGEDFRLQDWFVPVLFQEEQDHQLIRQLPAQQVREAFQKQAVLALGEVPALSHDFFGRGRDLLKAERMLAPGHGARYLTVSGNGGEGKTTFAAELARWLVATRRFERAAFASVEQITGADDVLRALGQQLVAGFDTEPEHQRLMLVERALRERRTVLLIDNMESLAAELSRNRELPNRDRGFPSRDGDGADYPEVLALCQKLNQSGETLLIFTTREALPAPFEANVIRMDRLDRPSAIGLLGKLRPKDAPESKDTQDDLEKLVDAVGCHARSLVLIAREVGTAGVRHATENLSEVMRAIEAKNPGNRENSLLASAELSLRRLSPEMRARIQPLAVFHGGGILGAIGLALDLKPEALKPMVDALVKVGLAELVPPGYVRFDPALLATDLSAEEREQAMRRWADAMAQVAAFLNHQRSKDTALANGLTLLDLPNLVAALEYSSAHQPPDAVVNFVMDLEPVVAPLNRPKALARIKAVRTEAAARLGADWSHARFEADAADIDRLIDEGRFGEARAAAQALHQRAEAAGEAAYQGAPYDSAMAKFKLGRVLLRAGTAAAALRYLQDARQRFQHLSAVGMASAALTESADCLTDLGRYPEAANAYEQAIDEDRVRGARRDVAVGKGQLATVRRRQKQSDEALRLYGEVREEFEQLNEPASVAAAWHQIGNVHKDARQLQAAEDAYQKSLQGWVQTGNKPGRGRTLNQLAILYAALGRTEESIRLTRQAADIYTDIGDVQSEGTARSNLAGDLVKVQRYAEARREITRAIECKQQVGHSAEPWTSFAILADLEHAEGNQPAALAARRQAIDAYLAYRRDGGEPRFDPSQLAAILNQGLAAARAAVNDPDLPYPYAVEVLLALERSGSSQKE